MILLLCGSSWCTSTNLLSSSTYFDSYRSADLLELDPSTTNDYTYQRKDKEEHFHYSWYDEENKYRSAWETVLLFEKENLAHFLSLELKEQYRVDQVEEGQKALSMALQTDYDLILLNAI